MISQIRKSALSVPCNIAEGYGRKTILDYIRSLYIAYGSLCELETQINLSGDLCYIEKDALSDLQKDISDIKRLPKALIKSLELKSRKL